MSRTIVKRLLVVQVVLGIKSRESCGGMSKSTWGAPATLERGQHPGLGGGVGGASSILRGIEARDQPKAHQDRKAPGR